MSEPRQSVQRDDRGGAGCPQRGTAQPKRTAADPRPQRVGTCSRSKHGNDVAALEFGVERINGRLTQWRESLSGSRAQTARELVNLLGGHGLNVRGDGG